MIKPGDYVFETNHKEGNFRLKGLVTSYPRAGKEYVVLDNDRDHNGWYMVRFCTSSLGHIGRPCVFCGQEDYWE